jgi:Ribbon-helix-helix protein, copG family
MVCIMLIMRRIQIHLEEYLDDALIRQAVERGISKAALIREYLSQHVVPQPWDRDDPSVNLIGIYDGGLHESDSIDDVVYGRAAR